MADKTGKVASANLVGSGTGPLYRKAAEGAGDFVSVMSHLSIELRVKLNAVESELGVLLARIARGEPDAELFVQGYLRRLVNRLKRKNDERIDAEAEVRQWQRELLDGVSEAGRALGTPEVLKARATQMRRCAFAAMELAAAAIDDATCATLQAWLAERRLARADQMQSDTQGSEAGTSRSSDGEQPI